MLTDPEVSRVVEGVEYGHSGRKNDWSFDVSELWNGRSENKSRGRLTGRPDLAESIYPSLCLSAQGVTRQSYGTLHFHITRFWLFLDEMEEVLVSVGGSFPSPASAIEVPGQIWTLYKDWLASLPTSGAHYSYYFCARIFNKIGELLGDEAKKNGFPLPPNPFENEQKIRARDGGDSDNVLDEALIRRVAAVLQYQVDGTRLRLEHPYESQPISVAKTAGRSDCISKLLDGDSFRIGCEQFTEYIDPWFDNWVNRSKRHAIVHWLVPAFRDILSAFALVGLRHGWNTSVTLALDPKNWFCHHELGARAVVKIFSRKMRAGGELQYSYSRESARDQSYQILLSVLSWTQPLRKVLEAEAFSLKKKLLSATRTPSEVSEWQQRLNRIADLTGSFWLYLTPFGEITSLDRHLKYASINSVFEAAGVNDSIGPFKFSQSICRNSWALFALEASGFNALVVKVALGHADLRTLLHYLDQKFVRNRNRREFLRLQTAIVDLIQDGSLSIQSLRQLVTSVPAEKVIHALGPDATVSRQGMACADPLRPDEGLDPGHKEGESCRSQQCLLGCSKAFITFTTLEFAARRVLELREIRDNTPLPAWIGSDNPHDLQFLEELMSLFSTRNVELAMQAASESKMPPFLTVPSSMAWDRGRE